MIHTHTHKETARVFFRGGRWLWEIGQRGTHGAVPNTKDTATARFKAWASTAGMCITDATVTPGTDTYALELRMRLTEAEALAEVIGYAAEYINEYGLGHEATFALEVVRGTHARATEDSAPAQAPATEIFKAP